MNRRGFLGMLATAVPAVTLARPDLARGGWISGQSFKSSVLGESVSEASMGIKISGDGVMQHLTDYVPTSLPNNIDFSIHGILPNPSPFAVANTFTDDTCRCVKCVETWSNTGHGHVRPRPDGVKARCGGPGLCCECSREKAVYMPPERRIIAFTGLAGSGKSTAALHLVNAHGWQRYRFAGPLKAMLAALGLTPAQIDGDQKEVPCELLGGKTPRWAQQTLGTEWGRDLIGPDLWTRAWLASLPATGNVVVDDLRFPNEVEAIRQAGGVIVRICRSGTQKVGAHISETHEIPATRQISNNESIATFLENVEAVALPRRTLALSR